MLLTIGCIAGPLRGDARVPCTRRQDGNIPTQTVSSCGHWTLGEAQISRGCPWPALCSTDRVAAREVRADAEPYFAWRAPRALRVWALPLPALPGLPAL